MLIYSGIYISNFLQKLFGCAKAFMWAEKVFEMGKYGFLLPIDDFLKIKYFRGRHIDKYFESSMTNFVGLQWAKNHHHHHQHHLHHYHHRYHHHLWKVKMWMADLASVDSRLFFARFNLSTPFAPDITHFKALSVLCENSLLFPFMFVDKKFR